MKVGGEVMPKTLPFGTIIASSWDKDYIEAVTAVEAKVGRAICGGKKRAPDEFTTQLGFGHLKGVCRQRPGAGTDHPGEGRCRKHAGMQGKNLLRTGNTSLLRHRRVAERFREYLDSYEFMNISSAVAAAWAVVDDALGDEPDPAQLDMDQMTDVVNALHKISAMVKQHHDMTEGQKLVIEVPQFMEWSEALFTIAIRYIQNAGGDIPGFLTEAQAYFTNTVDTYTGISSPALGAGYDLEAPDVLRPGE